MLARPPVVELELGLVADALEGRRAHLRDLRAGLALSPSAVERRRSRAAVSRSTWRREIAGDERQVVVGLPPLLAEARGSRRARSARPGTGRSAAGSSTTSRKRSREPPVVGEVVVGPEGLVLAGPADDVHRRAACAPGCARSARCRSRAGARAPASRAARASCRAPRRSRPAAASRKSASPRQPSCDEGRPGRRRARRPRIASSVARGGGVPADLPGLVDPNDARSPSEARYAASCSSPLRRIRSACAFTPERLLELPARDGDLQRRQVRAGEERRQVRRREQQPAAVVHAHAPESCVVDARLTRSPRGETSSRHRPARDAGRR